jgi:hypothetical protein
MNGERLMTWRETVASYLTIISLHSLVVTEENYEKPKRLADKST